MTIKIAERITRIKPSATMAVSEKANQLRAKGENIINLGFGEPDFDTPDYICKAGIHAIQDGQTRYTAADGTAELKNAIIKKLERDNNLSFESNQIIASTGAKQVLYNLTQAILEEGDEAIIPAPYWVSYIDMVKVTGADAIIIETDIKQNYKITAQQLEQAITPKTKMFFINSPSNPSGIAYTADELKAISEVLKRHPNIIIASDEIYEYILWSMDNYVNLLNVCPELKEQMVIINGVSKAYAMTGWRIGYAAGPQKIIGAMKKLQSQSTSSTCTISQHAAAVAMSEPKSVIHYMIEAYKERHEFVYNALCNMKNVEVAPADGTFYIFPNVQQAINKLGLKDDIEFANIILERAKVALVPGTAFGAPGHIRISYATDLATLDGAMRQIAEVVNNT